MEQNYNQIIETIRKYFDRYTNDQLIKIIQSNGNSLDKWEQFSRKFMRPNQREYFMNALGQHLKLTNQVDPPQPPLPQLPPIIIASNQIIEIPVDLTTIPLKRMKGNIEASPNLNKFLQAEISFIIDFFQRGNSLEDYFQSILNQCQKINNPLSLLFKQMKLFDFLILLKKSTGYKSQITYLLSLQVPICVNSPLNRQSIDLRPCLPFLRCDDYSLITNVGTKNTTKYQKLLFIHNLINLDGFCSIETVFQDNVNFLNIDYDRMAFMADFSCPLNLLSPSSNKLIQKTSLLILHATYDDLAEIIKQPPQFFQTIQKLIILIWEDNKLEVQISNQILQLFNQNSPLRISTNNKNLLNNYLIIANIDPSSNKLPNNAEDIKKIISSELINKNFNIHPEFYETKINAIRQSLLPYSNSPIESIFPNTDKIQKNTQTQFTISSFIEASLRYLQAKDYFQFTLFTQQLSKFRVQPISLDNIIYQINIYNEFTIDKQQQFQQSLPQNIINICYQRCLQNFLPFNIINEKITQFANCGLQRFWKYINAKFEKDIFIVSVIGADSLQKSQLINGLFRYNLYKTEYALGRGLYMSLCRISNINIVVFSTSKIIGQKITSFDHQIIVYLFKISNLVLLTNFNNSSRLKESLQICNLIQENILLNQDSRQILQQKIFVASQLIKQNLKTSLKNSNSLKENDVFTIPSKANAEEYGTFILNFRNIIVDNLTSKKRASGKFYEIYKKQKAQWQLLNNISQKLFQSKTLQQAEQNIKLKADYFLLDQQKKRQFIQQYLTQRKNKAFDRIDQIINAKQTIKQVDTTNETPTPAKSQQQRIISINRQKLIEQVNILIESTAIKRQQMYEAFSSINHQQITRLYNNINQYYKHDIKQYYINKKVQQLQLSIDSILQRQFKQYLTTNLDKQLQNNLQNIKLFHEKELQYVASLNQKDIKRDLQQTFQIILDSQHILKGALSIDNINKCVAFCNKFQHITIINNLEYFVKIQEQSSLIQRDRARINQMIENSLNSLDKNFKATYSSISIKETQFLYNFRPILQKINQTITKLVNDLKVYEQQIKKKISLVSINFKMYVLGKLYTLVIQQLLRKKRQQSSNRVKRIQSILVELQQKSKIVTEMRNYYLKIDSLLTINQNSLEHYKNEIFHSKIVHKNIIQICLKETIENYIDLTIVPLVLYQSNLEKATGKSKVQAGKEEAEPIAGKEEAEPVKEEAEPTAGKEEEEAAAEVEIVQKCYVYEQEIKNKIKQLYKDCFKIIKNTQRYLNEKIFAQSHAILQLLKEQQEILLAKLIQSIKKQTIQYEALHRPKYDTFLANKLNQQINKRILKKIKLTEIRLKSQADIKWGEILQFIKNQLSKSICKQKCPRCNAQCRRNVSHEVHQIQHYLRAYGGPEEKTNEFDLNLCRPIETEVIATQSIYIRKLRIVWANIQNALILTTYKQAQKSKSKFIIQQRKKCLFLTNQDLDEEIKGQQGLYKLRDY